MADMILIPGGALVEVLDEDDAVLLPGGDLIQFEATTPEPIVMTWTL